MNKLYPLLLEHHLPVPARYGITLAIMLICSVMQTALQMVTGYPGYFLLLPGVFLSGLAFDRGTGVLAAVIAVGVGAYFGYNTDTGFEYLAINGLFATTAAGTAVVAEFLRAEMKRVMQADRTKALLLQEMAHRTKNNLAILSAMIRLQAKNAEPTAVAALQDTARRIQVAAGVYDHLSAREDSRLVDMKYFLTDVVEKIFQSLAPSGPVAFEVVCNDAVLPHSKALTIGIIVNELVTNSLKYAFPNNRPGLVVVRLSASDEIELVVSDNGVGRSDRNVSSGLGSRIIMLLTEQIGGTLAYDDQPQGLCTRLCVPGPVSHSVL